MDALRDPTDGQSLAALRWRARDETHTPVNMAELGLAGSARLIQNEYAMRAGAGGPGRQPHGQGAVDVPLPPAPSAGRLGMPKPAGASTM